MFNPLERITLYNFIDLLSKGMQGLQVWENGSKQSIIICLGLLKCFKKNGIKGRLNKLL
jgi:hypothetical protein